MKVIMHIDVNNAFLSWTALKKIRNGFKYDIRKSYAVIGGDEKSRRGIVLAKSTPAKKRGVVTGETLYSARKKCPNLKVYTPDFKFYKKMSNSMFELIEKYSPDIEIMSIDECFLDYTPVKKLYGDEVEFAYKIKKEIFDTLGFTVNIGVANNKICAKMASDLSKPYKVHTLFKNEIEKKMWPLKVDKLFGIGKQTAAKLHNLNLHTIGDLANCDQKFLYRYFKNQGKVMKCSANGIGSDIVNTKVSSPKGIGNETTLSKDIYLKEELHPYLLSLCENVCIRLRRQNKYAYVVVIVIKDCFFHRKSHQKKLINATDSSDVIYKTAIDILSEMDISAGIRLIGVRLDNLVEISSHQTSLFENIEEVLDNKILEKTVDNIKEKYGYKAISKASLKHTRIRDKNLDK